MAILTQFIFRLSFGLAVGMAVTSPRRVTIGYYRNHLYVLLGLNVLATLVALASGGEFRVWPPAIAAVASYFGSAIWLYEKPRAGIAALWIVTVATLAGAWLAGPSLDPSDSDLFVLRLLDPLSSGLVLGVTLAAMFLGHWYLNTPTMELAPLRRLIKLMAAAVALRAILCGAGLYLEWTTASVMPHPAFVALRWLSGIGGTLLLAWMTWQTLKIPNTQSATGILYVAVIATFLGELTALLLSAGTVYPL